ncbi:hypothetical protein HDV03_002440 [Kappamyces sp. JEL0829]|nr:hypothetical protein HDV03_002440 [Kappamyces sp. JEL0829]
MNLTKYFDKATPSLFSAIATGKHLSKATLYVRRAAGGKPVVSVQYDLEDVTVTSSSISGTSGQDAPAEDISLSFAKITVSYTPIDNKGTALPAIKSCFNVASNSVC